MAIWKKRLEGPLTTIKISVKTRERLLKCGKMEDTYDSVVNKLLDEYQKLNKNV